MNRCGRLHVECHAKLRTPSDFLVRQILDKFGNRGDKQTDWRKNRTLQKQSWPSLGCSNTSLLCLTSQQFKDPPLLGDFGIFSFFLSFFRVAQMKLANVSLYTAGGGRDYRRTIGAAGVSARLVNFHSSPCWLAVHSFSSTLSRADRPLQLCSSATPSELQTGM